jgi:hypothetical protein
MSEKIVSAVGLFPFVKTRRGGNVTDVRGNRKTVCAPCFSKGNIISVWSIIISVQKNIQMLLSTIGM